MREWKKMKNDKFSRGFTIVELMVSMGILAIIFAISTLNLSTVVPSTSQVTAFDVLINDIRAQQTLAMSSGSDYGVYFEGTGYTLFKGDDFASGTEKFTVTLDPTVSITGITIPGNQIIFTAGSGDILGYVSGSDGFELTSSGTGKITEIRINKYGATY